jgi:hypothetical protein
MKQARGEPGAQQLQEPKAFADYLIHQSLYTRMYVSMYVSMYVRTYI